MKSNKYISLALLGYYLSVGIILIQCFGLLNFYSRPIHFKNVRLPSIQDQDLVDIDPPLIDQLVIHFINFEPTEVAHLQTFVQSSFQVPGLAILIDSAYGAIPENDLCGTELDTLWGTRKLVALPGSERRLQRIRQRLEEIIIPDMPQPKNAAFGSNRHLVLVKDVFPCLTEYANSNAIHVPLDDLGSLVRILPSVQTSGTEPNSTAAYLATAVRIELGLPGTRNCSTYPEYCSHDTTEVLPDWERAAWSTKRDIKIEKRINRQKDQLNLLQQVLWLHTWKPEAREHIYVRIQSACLT